MCSPKISLHFTRSLRSSKGESAKRILRADKLQQTQQAQNSAHSNIAHERSSSFHLSFIKPPLHRHSPFCYTSWQHPVTATPYQHMTMIGMLRQGLLILMRRRELQPALDSPLQYSSKAFMRWMPATKTTHCSATSLELQLQRRSVRLIETAFSCPP
jgi:hypothetical protein